MSDQSEFFSYFKQYLEQQNIRQQEAEIRNIRTQQTIVEILGLLQQPSNPGSTENLVGAPRKKTDTEFLIESLSSSITEFSYDPENDCIFENWYRRFEDLFQRDAINLDDDAKVRLLLRKLDTVAHTRYINFILPKTPSEFSFTESVEKLKKLFGRHESLFKTRFKCFKLFKTDEMNYLDYMGNVNKACEDFELNKISIDQFKCLIFVAGLSSTKELDIRTKLLSKLDNEHENITLEKLTDEYGRLMNIRKDSSMIQKSNFEHQSILVSQVTQNHKDNHASTSNQTEVENKAESENSSSENADPCHNCGNKKRHFRAKCPARDAVCHFCHIPGHFEKCCLKKKTQNENSSNDNGSNNKNSARINTIFCNKTQKSHNNVASVFRHNQNRKYIDIQINFKPVCLQIDTGADISIISKETCKLLHLEATPIKSTATDASGQNLNLIGELRCCITALNITKVTTIYVSENENLNVFGNDLFNTFGFDEVPINEICSKNVQRNNTQLKRGEKNRKKQFNETTDQTF